MTLDANTLQKLLCQQLCEDVRVHQCADGELMLDSQFRFPDGDTFPIQMSGCRDGNVRLSDEGDTFMRISYEHDVDSFFKGTRGVLLDHILSEGGVEWEGGALTVRTSQEGLAEAIFRFGQTITRVYDLTLPTRISRPTRASTFYQDLSELLFRCLDPEKLQSDYRPDVPNPESYLVDYRIDSGNESPVFLYGVPNQGKARLTAVKFYHFHRLELRFDPLVIFNDESLIPKADRARLADVGCESIPSLSSYGEFQGQLKRILGPKGTAPTNGQTFQSAIGD